VINIFLNITLLFRLCLLVPENLFQHFNQSCIRIRICYSELFGQHCFPSISDLFKIIVVCFRFCELVPEDILGRGQFSIVKESASTL